MQRPSTANARLGGTPSKKSAIPKPKVGSGTPPLAIPPRTATPKAATNRDQAPRPLREQGAGERMQSGTTPPTASSMRNASPNIRAASPNTRTESPSTRMASPRTPASPRRFAAPGVDTPSSSKPKPLVRQRTAPNLTSPGSLAQPPTMTPVTPSKRAGKAGSAMDRVLVAVRKRPAKEAETDIVDVLSATEIQVAEPRQKVDLTKYTEWHQFQFDAALGADVDNVHVYRRTVLPLADFVIQGGMGSVFAFGQTGSGKTFTMLGAGDQEGLFGLAVDDIFNRKDREGFEVRVSMMEIYGDEVFDLLSNRNKLIPREDSKKKVQIKGLECVETEDRNHIMLLVQAGSALRCTSVTGMNETSSRSHAIIQLSLWKRDRQHGLLSFIDLAGSEKGSDTGENEKKTRLEGAEINKSLLALKECIRAMNDPQSGFTPFRGSKLTLILRESFVGSGRTVMIANISPHAGSCVETVNTLRYADRVKQIGSTGRPPAQSGPLPSATGSTDAEAEAEERGRIVAFDLLGGGGGEAAEGAEHGAESLLEFAPLHLEAEDDDELDSDRRPSFSLGNADSSRQRGQHGQSPTVAPLRWGGGSSEEDSSKEEGPAEEAEGRVREGDTPQGREGHLFIRRYREETERSMALVEQEVAMLDWLERGTQDPLSESNVLQVRRLLQQRQQIVNALQVRRRPIRC